MSTDDSFDRLIEALTIERSLEDAISPPYGGYNGGHTRWLGYQWKIKGNDIVYRNTDGKLHRIFGPAYISENYDVEIWYKNGQYHRIGGPAIRHKQCFLWYEEGKLHRLDGPAVMDPGGPKQFWIAGQRLSPKDYKKEISRRKRKGLIK